MKIRSTPLYTHLFETGALNGTPEEIDSAKRQYRRLYKKQWKKAATQKKEIRIEVTPQQFEAIKAKAQTYQQKHTTYARALILSDVESKKVIPHRDQLLKALQLVSMTTIALAKNSMPTYLLNEWLERSEAILLKYLNT